MTSNDYKKIILSSVNDLLKLRHFKKSGHGFKKSNGDLTYYIGLQSSKHSTSEILTLTFNTGIASDLLYKLQGKFITNHLQGHYLKRIGDYLEQPADKWWTIDSENFALTAANEIVTILDKKVIPEFNSIIKIQDLIDIWLTEISENSHNIQTQEYLALLSNAQIGNSTNSSM
jgi:Domain of unknown function (DUF4304)